MCISNIECNLEWIYRGDPDTCKTMHIQVVANATQEIVNDYHNVSNLGASEAGGAHIISTESWQDFNTFTLTLSCEDTGLSDSSVLRVAFTPPPSPLPSSLPSAVPS